MAIGPTQFTTSDVQVVKRWSERLYADVISDETLVGQARKDGSLVLLEELSKGPGDNVKYHLNARISDKGLIGDQSANGVTKALVYYQTQLSINELRMPVEIPNTKTISAQRVTFNMPEDAYARTRDWMIERMTVGFLWQAAGFTSTSFTYDGETYTSADYVQLLGMNTPTAPTSTRIVRPNSLTTDQAVNSDTTATMKFVHIDEAVSGAMKNRPYILPLSGIGAIKFKVYVHIDGFRQLIQDTSAPVQYRDIMLNKIASGVNDAELIGETMQYNNCLIIATDKIPNGVHSSTGAVQTNVRRAVLVGAGAVGMAFGQGFAGATGMSFAQDETDIQKWKRIAAVSLFGQSKAVFNSIDYATTVISHYVA